MAVQNWCLAVSFMVFLSKSDSHVVNVSDVVSVMLEPPLSMIPAFVVLFWGHTSCNPTHQVTKS